MMMKRILFSALLVSLFIGAFAQQSRHNAETVRRLDIFNALYRDLDLYYVDTLEAKKNIDNAILYMLSQLDPYTVYYPEDKAGDLRQMTTGKYAGIGSVISYRKDLGRCVIAHPYEGMPAVEAGLRRGDQILAIDGQDVGIRTTDDPGDYSTRVSEALRGQPGTTFELRVRREGVHKPMTFRLTRRNIVLPSITMTEMLSDTVGYILLNGYTEKTSHDMRLAVADLKQRGACRLVLDLRGNPGGLMSQAVEVVNLFIPRGKVVLSTKGRTSEQTATLKTTNSPLDLTMPIAVLVDFGSASAAEITAGALQDYDRAVIVGRRTYGKGLVQESRELPYNTFLKLTTSRYYIPSGRCVQAYKFEDGEPVHLPDSLAKEFHTEAGRVVRDGGGITPDVTVEMDSLPNLLAYLSISDALFDYVVHYRNTHDAIAAPADFRLTDKEYADFRAFLKEKKFTYDNQSQRVLEALREVARREGYSEEAKAELDALEAKLIHNEDFDFQHWERDIRELVEQTIVEAYYYDAGAARYSLRDDRDLKRALEVLTDDTAYRQLLSAPSGHKK